MRPRTPRRSPDTILHGIGVSAGFAYGPLYTVAPFVALPLKPTRAAAAAEEDLNRTVAALEWVAEELSRRADAAAEPTVTDILRAQALTVEDPQLRDRVAQLVHGGVSGPHAIDRALAEYRAAFLEAAGTWPSGWRSWTTFVIGPSRRTSDSPCPASLTPDTRTCSAPEISRRPRPPVSTRRSSSRW
jgi:hypothetical protein